MITAHLPLFDRRPYPDGPGAAEVSTSLAAADHMDAQVDTLRAAVLEVLAQHPAGLTADEAARHLGRSILAIRPRFTELRRQGRIADTDQRRANASGRKAIVWRRIATDEPNTGTRQGRTTCTTKLSTINRIQGSSEKDRR